MRTVIGSALLGITLWLAMIGAAPGQNKPMPPSAPAGFSGIQFIEDKNRGPIIDVGRTGIQDRDWARAVQVLQALLNNERDGLIQVRETDPGDPKKEFLRWTSAKFEANRLLGSMPAAGLEVYEKIYGPEAKKMLDDAKATNDDALLAQLAHRYRHTKAGSAAHAILVQRFEKTMTDKPAADANAWPSWRGNITNTRQADADAPKLDKPIFRRPLFKDKFEDLEEDNDEVALDRVNKALKHMRDANVPVLPGGFPIVSQDILVLRGPRDVRAIALKPVDLKAEGNDVIRFKTGEILWKSIPFERSVALLLEKTATRNRINPWLDAYHRAPGFDSFLFDNTVLGTLVTDHRFVYAINDMGVPPHPDLFRAQLPKPGKMDIRDVKPMLLGNELCAYDLKHGKMIWDLKGIALPSRNDAGEVRDAVFDHSHFISLPISLGGKLYVLNEKLLHDGGLVPGESDIRLVCIDPAATTQQQPKIAWLSDPLGTAVQDARFVQNLSRRVNAIQLAYADGILVCPTNAGEMFGVDLRMRELAWSYSYREKPPLPIGPPVVPLDPEAFPRPPLPKETTTVVSKWKSAPPAIEAGKIVFTAPDADSIHSIHLRDGKPAWRKSRQSGDLYFAGVFAGRVLVVNEKNIRALDLKTGAMLWTTETGDLPSGQGAASKGSYYLPLQKGEIIAIDVAKGEIKARQRVKDGTALGNLVFYGDVMLSQTATEILAFR